MMGLEYMCRCFPVYSGIPTRGARRRNNRRRFATKADDRRNLRMAPSVRFGMG